MAKRTKRNAAPVQEAPSAPEAPATEAPAQEQAQDVEQEAGLLVDASAVGSMDTDTLRMLADGVADTLNAGEVDTAELQAQYRDFVVAARAELRSRDAGALDAAREAAALAVQERANKLAAMGAAQDAASAAQDGQEAPLGACAGCGQDIPADQEALLADGGDMVHPDCVLAYTTARAAAAPASAPQRPVAAREARPEAPAAPADILGHPVPPARCGNGWDQHRINVARQAIWEARTGAEPADPTDGACFWCLQPYRGNSAPMVGQDGRSYHPVCARFIGQHAPVRASRAAVPAASVAEVSAVDSRVAALEKQLADMAALLSASLASAGAAPVASREDGAA